MSPWQLALLTSILPLTAGFGTGVLFERSQTPSSSIELSLGGSSWNGISFEKLETVKKLLETHYVSPELITPQKMEEWMIRGVLYSVEDPYTDFFNEQQSQDFSKDMQGDFEGIGAALDKQKGKIVITEVMKGRPAAEVGLLPGDVIFSVDGETTEKETIYQAVERIRGKKGTTVSLEIYRNGEMKKFDIVRENIHVENVSFEMKNDIALFEINQFGDTLEDEFEKAFQEMQKNNPKGIILDLRYNGGGYMDGAVALASYFLPENTKVMSLKEGQKQDEASFSKVQRLKDLNTKMIVLVNGGTASASEILAGALRDNKRSIIVGEKTFGKGVVQQIFPLSLGSDEMAKITIAKWFTPNGQNVTHENPIVPEKEISWDKSVMTDAEKEKKYDPQLEASITLLSQ